MCKVVNTIKLFLVDLVEGRCDGTRWDITLLSWQNQYPFWSQMKQLTSRVIRRAEATTIDKWAAKSHMTATKLSLEIMGLQILVSTPWNLCNLGYSCRYKIFVWKFTTFNQNEPLRKIMWQIYQFYELTLLKISGIQLSFEALPKVTENKQFHTTKKSLVFIFVFDLTNSLWCHSFRVWTPNDIEWQFVVKL